MDATRIDLFGLAERRMQWLERRAGVLAENVANADTPGWQPRDLQPFAEALQGAGFGPARTQTLHFAGSQPDAVIRPQSGETAPDGNGVRLDAELTRLAETESAQTLVTDLWRKYLGLFRTALGR